MKKIFLFVLLSLSLSVQALSIKSLAHSIFGHTNSYCCNRLWPVREGSNCKQCRDLVIGYEKEVGRVKYESTSTSKMQPEPETVYRLDQFYGFYIAINGAWEDTKRKFYDKNKNLLGTLIITTITVKGGISLKDKPEISAKFRFPEKKPCLKNCRCIYEIIEKRYPELLPLKWTWHFSNEGSISISMTKD